jgi:SAM-dependent methyltransferase
MSAAAQPAYEGCSIPPDIYDIAFAWDPRPEVERLLFLAGECGVAPRSALELGCGTARLFPSLAERVGDLAGIELNPEMAALAEQRLHIPPLEGRCNITRGDMSSFSLGRQFDLIYTTANTIRHVLTLSAIQSMWRCVAAHLQPAGVFIADLEFGVAAEAAKVDKPATWYMARGDRLVHVAWTVTRPPDAATRVCGIEWIFEQRDGGPPGTWRQSFDLRTYDADEFLAFATAGGRLSSRGVFEIREPYVLPVTPDRAVGRHLAVLQRDA